MTERKGASLAEWSDADDAPELTEAMVAGAEVLASMPMWRWGDPAEPRCSGLGGGGVRDGDGGDGGWGVTALL